MPTQDKKPLRVFGWASFLNDFGSDMIFPIWPLFLTSVLGANMAILGLIDGIGEALVSISQTVSGYIADKSGKRKIFVWLGYVFAGLARLGYASAAIWQHVIPFRILDRAGKMRGAPRDAIIADLSTDQDRGRNFGYLRTMDNLGAVFGVLFTILFFNYLGFRNIFFIAALPSLVGAFLIYLNIKESTGTGVKVFKGLTFKHLNRDLKLYMLLSAIFALASFSYSFLLVYANRFGFAIAAVPVLYLLYTAVGSVVSLPFGKMADRINRKTVLIMSFVFWLMVCAILIYFHNTAGIIIAFVLYGLHLGAIEPVQRALVSELAEPDFRASVLGGFKMVVGLAALPASLIAGFLWDRVSIAAPFYFSALLTVLAIGMMMFVKERRGINH